MATRRHTHQEGVHHAPPEDAAPAKAKVVEPVVVEAAPEPVTLPSGYVRCRAKRTVLVHGMALFEGNVFPMLEDEAKSLADRGEVEIIQ